MNSNVESSRSVSPKAAIIGNGYVNGDTTSSRNSNSTNKANCSKKKKKGSRRRGENEIYKAADNAINAQFQLDSIIFPKSSYVVGVKRANGKAFSKQYPVIPNQFEDAAEIADRQLRQNRADYHGVGRPPFGYFSLHPSSLSVHPPHAVHYYYPATPNMFSSWMHTSSAFSSNGAQTAAPSPQVNCAESYNYVQHHHPQHQHPASANPKAPQCLMAQSRPAMSAMMSPQHQVHQQQSPQHQHLAQGHAATLGFLEFARNRQQQQQEHARHQGALNETSPHGQLRQTQPQQPPSGPGVSPKEKRHIEHLQQQQESTAAVLASMRGTVPNQPTPSRLEQSYTGAAYAAAQVKLTPTGTGRAQFSVPAAEGCPQGQESGAHHPAWVSDETSRKVPEVATKYMDQRKDGQMYSSYGHPQAQVTHQQQTQRPPAPKAYAESSQSPQSIPMQKGAVPSEQPSEDNATALDENGAGAMQFVKRMITTSDESPLTTGMENLEILPMLMYTPPDSKHERPVREQEITNCDVLLGRGGMTNHHVGNMHFRTLVSSFRLHYCAAKKGDKGRLSKKLTNFVRHKKGRFLQKDDLDNRWYEVGDSRAHGKCAQALREGTADLNRQVAHGAPFLEAAPAGETSMGMPSYPKAYSVRPPGAAPHGTSPTLAPRYHHPHHHPHRPTEAQRMYSSHGAMHAVPPPPPVHPHVPCDKASPRCVTSQQPSPGQGEETAKNRNRVGHSPVAERPRPQLPKRPLVKTPSTSRTNGQAQAPQPPVEVVSRHTPARKPPVVPVPTQGIRPAKAPAQEAQPCSKERYMSPQSNDIKSAEGGGQYAVDESRMADEDEAEDESSRKRMKVQHVAAEDHYDVI